MPMPGGLGIVDLMLGFPIADYDKTYDFLRKAARDKESKESSASPSSTCSRASPTTSERARTPSR